MRALLDTSVVVTGLRLDGIAGAVSVVTVAELRYGVARRPPEPELQVRRTRLAHVRRTYAPLPVDEAVAEAWGELAAHCLARGRQPRRRAMDLMIAATAQAHGLTLLSLDDDLLWLSDVLDVRRP